MNDLSKKTNKNILLIGHNDLFLKYLESILYYGFQAANIPNDDLELLIFTVDNIENNNNMNLKKYKFTSGKFVLEPRGRRRLTSSANL